MKRLFLLFVGSEEVCSLCSVAGTWHVLLIVCWKWSVFTVQCGRDVTCPSYCLLEVKRCVHCAVWQGRDMSFLLFVGSEEVCSLCSVAGTWHVLLIVVVSCVDMSLTTLKHYLVVVLTLCIVPYTCRPATDIVCALLRNPSTRCKRYLVEFQTFVASENTPRFVEWGWLPFSSYFWPVCVYCNDCGHMCIFASWYLIIWRVFLLELTFHTLWYACFFFLLFFCHFMNRE